MRTWNLAYRSLALGMGLSVVLGCATGESLAPGEQVKGAQLQAWLDAQFSYAGLHRPSGCYLLNTGGVLRTLFLSCPNGWNEKVVGTARVSGDMLCTKFPVPNTSGDEECLTWYGVGGDKYEQRKDGAVDTSLFVLPARAAAGR